jgi:hypothetical protein
MASSGVLPDDTLAALPPGNAPEDAEIIEEEENG